jgi:hypothetical protein
VTDENGDYEITDLAGMTSEEWFAPKPVPGENASIVLTSLPRVYCRHPDFGYKWTTYNSIPGIANFLLQPGGVIDGRVVYAETGQPAAGVVVRTQRLFDGGSSAVLTDGQGKYEFRSLRAVRHNIWTVAEGWTALAIDSFQVGRGETRTAPDLKLVRGGIVQGRLVDADTGKPISYAAFLAPFRGIPVISVKGPARPFSGAGQMPVRFDPDGSYRFRAPPGENFISFSPTWPWKLIRPQRPEPAERVEREYDRAIPVLVSEGETIEIEFEIRLDR